MKVSTVGLLVGLFVLFRSNYRFIGQFKVYSNGKVAELKALAEKFEYFFHKMSPGPKGSSSRFKIKKIGKLLDRFTTLFFTNPLLGVTLFQMLQVTKTQEEVESGFLSQLWKKGFH